MYNDKITIIHKKTAQTDAAASSMFKSMIIVSISVTVKTFGKVACFRHKESNIRDKNLNRAD